MEKHFIDVFVPHRKLRKVYYLVSALLLMLWIPDLNKLNIPLPSKVLETWFLDKLLLTTIVLLMLYAFSAYFLSNIKDTSATLIPPISSQTQETEQEEEKAITEMHEKIMELLFQKPSTVKNICSTLNITKEETNFYLFDLYQHSMVSAPTPYASGPEEWRICQGGREYIMKKRATA